MHANLKNLTTNLHIRQLSPKKTSTSLEYRLPRTVPTMANMIR